MPEDPPNTKDSMQIIRKATVAAAKVLAGLVVLAVLYAASVVVMTLIGGPGI